MFHDHIERLSLVRVRIMRTFGGTLSIDSGHNLHQRTPHPGTEHSKGLLALPPLRGNHDGQGTGNLERV